MKARCISLKQFPSCDKMIRKKKDCFLSLQLPFPAISLLIISSPSVWLLLSCIPPFSSSVSEVLLQGWVRQRLGAPTSQKRPDKPHRNVQRHQKSFKYVESAVGCGAVLSLYVYIYSTSLICKMIN